MKTTYEKHHLPISATMPAVSYLGIADQHMDNAQDHFEDGEHQAAVNELKHAIHHLEHLLEMLESQHGIKPAQMKY